MGRRADTIRDRHVLLRAMREFFFERGYIEVETPYLSRSAPPDPYIEPLRVYVAGSGPYYLHTSPEAGMKKLIGRGHRKIFQICKAFRVEEFEEHHSIEFTMLEWYMEGTYAEAMAETADLIRAGSRAMEERALALPTGPWQTLSLRDLFLKTAGFDPMPLDRETLFSAMKERGFRGASGDDAWEDLFFRLFVQDLEPAIREKGEGPLFIKDWPVSLTAMARRKDSLTVERFELYIQGLEIANGYTELLDAEEQRERLLADNAARKRQGKETLPIDEALLDALTLIPGPIAGVSVGVDRLLMVLTGRERIGDVLPNRLTIVNAPSS